MPQRIFCYGDSLTAGTSPPSDQLHPYGPHLERELIASGHKEVMVRWRGLPGWTASAMADYLDDGSVGLNPVLDGIQDPKLSLVILLAGTNDIGALTSSLGSGGGEIDATSAVEPILNLHAACHERNIPTIAMGIPGSGWQEMNTDASSLCREMNELLQDFANGREKEVTYVGFPFAYQRGDAKWCGDGLHLSAEGYETLGKALAPSVGKLLAQ
ncbi:hypothetical protein ACHAXT_002839 [Thalassiosira profunda]